MRAGGRLWVPVEVSPAIRVAQGQAEQAAKSLSRGGGGSSRRVICVARGVAWLWDHGSNRSCPRWPDVLRQAGRVFLERGSLGSHV